jgi:hypothetical protein
MVLRLPSPLPSPPGRGNGGRKSLDSRKSVCLSLVTGCAKRGADEWPDGSGTQEAGERFSLSSGERVGGEGER